MARGDVVVNILGDSTSAQRALSDVENRTQGFGKKMGTILGAVGGVALAKGVFDFAQGSVEAFQASEDSAMRLQDAFAKFPKLADSNIESFQKLNESLAKKTKFDDDATASGQAVLAQFGLTGKQIEQITPLLQDYAAKTGKDIPGAAEVLGKAMIGNAKALKEVGINIPKATDFGKSMDAASQKVESTAKTVESAQRRLNDLKEIQATKDKLTVQDQIALRNAEAAVADATNAHSAATEKLGRIQQNAAKELQTFDKVTAGLRAQVGGFAEKEGQTAAGKAEILKNQFGELQETVGAKLMPVLITLTNWLLKIVDFFANLNPGIQTAIGVAAGLAAAAFVVVQAVQAWTAVQAALNVVMSANPIGLLVVAIAALVAAFVWAYKNVDWFREGLHTSFAALVATAKWLGAVFANVWDGIVAGFRWVRDTLKSIANWIAQNVINPVIGGVNALIRGRNAVMPGDDMKTLALLPVFHKGGVVPGPRGADVPIMAQAGETVLPVGASRGGGNVYVTVQTGQVLATERDIDDAVRSAVERVLARGGSFGNGRGASLQLGT